MSTKNREENGRLRHHISAAIAGGTLAGLIFAGCGGAKPASEAPAKAVTPGASYKIPPTKLLPLATSVEVTVDFHTLHKNPDACDDGKIADCAQPLYFQPEEPTHKTIDDVANQVVSIGIADGVRDYEAVWPLESFGKFPGDKVKVVCQVTSSDTISNAFGQSTNIWNVIEAPARLLSHSAIAKANAEMVAENANPNYHPEFGFQQSAGHINDLYLYASALWTNHTVNLGLQACSSRENPSGYPSITTK